MAGSGCKSRIFPYNWVHMHSSIQWQARFSVVTPGALPAKQTVGSNKVQVLICPVVVFVNFQPFNWSKSYCECDIDEW